jgi:hypothetical protein
MAFFFVMQVVHSRIACEERPCLVQFELWQQHVILTPACGVLLLPAALSEAAAELTSLEVPASSNEV